jgi:hypothetical protein
MAGKPGRQRGYAGTTIADIAAAAEVSPATVFGYFPSKDDILFHDYPQPATLTTYAAWRRAGRPLSLRSTGRTSGWP